MTETSEAVDIEAQGIQGGLFSQEILKELLPLLLAKGVITGEEGERVLRQANANVNALLERAVQNDQL